MLSKKQLYKTKITMLILLLIIIISFIYVTPIINYFLSLLLIPIILYHLKKILSFYVKRKCPKCGSIMKPKFKMIFDGAENPQRKLGFPPIAIKEESCIACSGTHLALFNPIGVISFNVGNFNALHYIADDDFVKLHLKAIDEGGRLPSSRYITPKAYQLLVRVLISKVRNTNMLSGFKQSDKNVKDFIRYLERS